MYLGHVSDSFSKSVKGIGKDAKGEEKRQADNKGGFIALLKKWLGL